MVNIRDSFLGLCRFGGRTGQESPKQSRNLAVSESGTGRNRRWKNGIDPVRSGESHRDSEPFMDFAALSRQCASRDGSGGQSLLRQHLNKILYYPFRKPSDKI
jgi:hypothetical protein